MNLTPKPTEELIHQHIDSAFKVYKRYSALEFKKVELCSSQSYVTIQSCLKKRA